MRPPTLAETQKYLWRLITAPEGVAAGLAAMDDEDPELAARLGEIVAGDHGLSAVQRLEVYANMYFFRLLDSIKEDYPAVLAVIGERAFHNLITDYVLAHPSEHWSLRYAGQHVPRFLRQLAPGLCPTAAVTEEHPWLAALAQLEWAILDAFDAADTAALAAEDLEGLSPEDWADVRFVPTPALRLLELDWKVDDLRERALRDEAPGEPEPGPSALRIWRRDLRVYHCPLDALERDCLRLLLAGEPFAAWCEHAADSVGDESAAERVVAILQRWIMDGALAGWEISRAS